MNEDRNISKDQIDEILKEAFASSKPEYFNILRPDECSLLCSSGKCKAECCGCVDFLEHDFRQLRKFIPDGVKYEEYKLKIGGNTYVKPLTENCKCVFLSKENSCLIYNSRLRPVYCKRFGEDRTEPLFACVHINEELTEYIDEFSRLYLLNQMQNGNPIAAEILSKSVPPDQNNENVDS